MSNTNYVSKVTITIETNDGAEIRYGLEGDRDFRWKDMLDTRLACGIEQQMIEAGMLDAPETENTPTP